MQRYRVHNERRFDKALPPLIIPVYNTPPTPNIPNPVNSI